MEITHNLPELPAGTASAVPTSGVGPVTAGFMSGSDGKSGRLSWARYANNTGLGFGWSYQAAVPHAEGPRISAALTDLQTGNSLVATIVDQAATSICGEGLTLSSRIDATALGITPDEAKKLSRDIEREWNGYASSPLECDLAGVSDFHQLAFAGCRSYLLSGEILTSSEWYRDGLSRYGTKVRLLDPLQLSSRHEKQGPLDGPRCYRGVWLDAKGRVTGYSVMPKPAGSNISSGIPVNVRARSAWGRPQVALIFEATAPGQVRGASPLVAAATPALDHANALEFTLASFLLRSQFAATIESELPSNLALAGLGVNDELSATLPGSRGTGISPSLTNGTTLDAMMASRAGFYSEAKVQANPGTFSHLHPGDKLRFNTADANGNDFEPFERSLARSAAAAAGLAYETVSGDYSKTSFSAARLAIQVPHRITLRRRKVIARFYQLHFEAWLEEAVATGRVVLPRRLMGGFYPHRAALISAVWSGAGAIVADPLKQAQADVLRVENHLDSLTAIHAAQGSDFEQFVEQRKRENDLLRAAGLTPADAIPTRRGTRDPNHAERD
ncbi:phage portal protein [Phreatobacter aquaticus]|uniref:Phage portal protein n=1 Tax=Phreatobacter aquaticus TaxID=2570229 RepID=A0A4D7QII8_9HYPH|nr:phage portal protein [Phreatobacter aquaticus]QCK87248.1 phage portal protein [Phreatobacter aquaticus]